MIGIDARFDLDAGGGFDLISGHVPVSVGEPVRLFKMKNFAFSTFATLAALLVSVSGQAAEKDSLRARLGALPYGIIHESYVNGNWELFVMNADGSEARNLTNTPGQHEMYPQVSPDGTKVCFVADEGEGRDTVRSVHVMDVDGTNRRKLADGARQPFWHPNSHIVGYLPQEYPKWNVVDYYTRGIVFFDLETGKSEAHPNNSKLHHLYNPNFSPDGRWIVATVHAGMGLGHGILLIEARGNRIVDLKIPGCRPCLSPTGKEIAWGPGDHEIAVAPINLDADEPKVGEPRVQILDKTKKIYHVDWSPDGRFISLSRGPNGEGDISKPGTHASACEIVGVYAPGWDIYAISAERSGQWDIADLSDSEAIRLTDTGASNKESAWFRSAPKTK